MVLELFIILKAKYATLDTGKRIIFMDLVIFLITTMQGKNKQG
jgi:hypothetical protein